MPSCCLPMQLPKLIQTMSHPYRRDDSARHHHETAKPSSVSRPSREIGKSSAVAMSEPSLAASPYGRGSTFRRRTLSVTQFPAQQLVDVGRDDTGRQFSFFSRDQMLLDPREGEGIKRRDELRSAGDDTSHRTQVRRDTQHGLHHSPSKSGVDIDHPLRTYTGSTESATPASSHPLEIPGRELSAVQHERDKLLEEKKALEKDLADLQHHCDEQKKRLESESHERKLAQEAAAKRDSAFEALGLKSQEQAKKIDHLRYQRNSTIEQRQKLEQDYAALERKYERQEQEYDLLNQKYMSAKADLKQRMSELQGVQKFISTVNTYSGTEVVNMLRKLNEDVQQNTPYMVEWAFEQFAFKTPRADEMVIETAEQTKAAKILGARFMDLLWTREHSLDNYILVEMALQAYLIYFLHWIASPLSIEQEERSHGIYVEGIYQRMRETEGQAISGNWRALTRAHTLPPWINDHGLARAIDSEVIVGFSDILSAAGCTTPKADTASALGEKFADKIHQFVLIAGQVKKFIGVGIVSEDYEIMVVPPGTTFDDRQMENSYDSGERLQGAARSDTVLCTTELGLAQHKAEAASGGERAKLSKRIVIKPKVALISVLDQL